MELEVNGCCAVDLVLQVFLTSSLSQMVPLQDSGCLVICVRKEENNRMKRTPQHHRPYDTTTIH